MQKDKTNFMKAENLEHSGCSEVFVLRSTFHNLVRKSSDLAACFTSEQF